MIYSLLSVVALAMFSCDASLVRRLQQAPPQLGGGAAGGSAVISGAGGAAAGYNPYGAAAGVGGAPQLPGLAGGAQPVVPGVGGAGFVAPGVGAPGVGAGNGAIIPGPGYNPYMNNGLAPQIDIIPRAMAPSFLARATIRT